MKYLKYGSLQSVFTIKMIMNCILFFVYYFSRNNLNHNWSEADILKLAAGVEANTVHPIAKAIVEAAQAVNCLNVKVSTSLDD